MMWPRSLAGRTGLSMAAVLFAAQIAGLTIFAYDRADLLRLGQARDLGVRAVGLYRTVALVSAEQRPAVVAALDARADGPSLTLSADPPAVRAAQQPLGRMVRQNLPLFAIPQPLRPRQVMLAGGYAAGHLDIALHIPDGPWLVVAEPLAPPRSWYAANVLIAFAVMSVAAVLVSVWAARTLVAPVGTLAAAADALGRDVAAPPLPEAGAAEVVMAARAFNAMAERLRRGVAERTLMLTAISHDLRTPITRLRLRAEFMDDTAQRTRMLADLDELEALVSATLAFGRDSLGGEASVPLDLPELLRSVLDAAADARAEGAEGLSYAGPGRLVMDGRPLALRRAWANIVANAIAYGGAARVTLTVVPLTVAVEDDGPGVPVADRARVFDPFVRLEGSRNRATGGVGLGLPIARELLRAQGWELSMEQAEGAGARVVARHV